MIYLRMLVNCASMLLGHDSTLLIGILKLTLAKQRPVRAPSACLSACVFNAPCFYTCCQPIQMKCHFDKHSWKGYSILTFHWSKYFLEIATSTFFSSFIFSLVLTFNNCIYANVVCFSG
ncbi:hypothetical protein T05_5024 [Trichinella murrelli]|uniref:Uncharacterized protein n=1 Tax=Trichinella murrelli TaxID=144512 RepID=A0A0V0TCP1_9BILA|nr:hypothetical protein T05_5024 [Trichinella murrelli]